LREDHPIGLLAQVHLLLLLLLNERVLQRIPLLDSELVRAAPLIDKYVTVYGNGSMELTRSLNYEMDRDLQLTLLIDGLSRGLLSPLH
jgi:hypothetical protein